MTTQPRSICPIVSFDDFEAGIRLLVDVFGFEEAALYRDDQGAVQHCELRWGETIVMPAPRSKSGPWIPGPSSLYLALDDTDAHHDRSVAAGLEIVMPLTDQHYGSREYSVRDTSGNVWTFGTYRPGASA